jgi:hypothetical protein
MSSQGAARVRVAHSVPDCQPILQNEIITFSWLHNAEVSVTMLSGDSIHLAPEKFKASVNIEEPAEPGCWMMQTVAHKITFCLP